MELATGTHWQRGDIELFLLAESDVGPAYVGWLNDPRVNRYLESRFRAHTIESTREFVRACRESPATLFLGIRSSVQGGRHVGNIKLGPIDRRHGLGEIGVLVGDPESWGRGVASTAIALLCDLAHEQLGLRKLMAGCYAGNASSEKAFLRAGFQVEGRRRAHFLLDGVPEDLVLMARWMV